MVLPELRGLLQRLIRDGCVVFRWIRKWVEHGGGYFGWDAMSAKVIWEGWIGYINPESAIEHRFCSDDFVNLYGPFEDLKGYQRQVRGYPQCFKFPPEEFLKLWEWYISYHTMASSRRSCMKSWSCWLGSILSDLNDLSFVPRWAVLIMTSSQLLPSIVVQDRSSIVGWSWSSVWLSILCN